FHAGQRPKSVEALVEGLRDIRLRERAGRPLAYALAGILLLLAGGWFALGQWRARQMAEVVAGFKPGDAHRYANETQAFAALAGLGEDGRRQLVLAHGDVVQSYLLERVDAYWNPARGRHDYAAASRVFALPAELHLFLPQLELRRLAVDKEKHDLDQPKPAATPANPSSPPVVAAGRAASRGRGTSRRRRGADAQGGGGAAAGGRAELRATEVFRGDCQREGRAADRSRGSGGQATAATCPAGAAAGDEQHHDQLKEERSCMHTNFAARDSRRWRSR